MELYKILERVSDQETFFEFVRALIEDRNQSIQKEKQEPSSPYGADAGGWENVTIEGYFEAALGWAEDTKKDPSQGLSSTPSWKAFATFLFMGKHYE